MRKAYQVIDAVPNNPGSVGACTHCGAPATKQALFKQPGAVIIEKYCDACMEPKVFERIQTIYSRIG